MGEAACPSPDFDKETVTRDYARRIYEAAGDPINKIELFNVLSELLWNYAEYAYMDIIDMWNNVFKTKHNEIKIEDLLTNLFVINSKWLQRNDGTLFKYTIPGPSILFLELLLHIIQYINVQELTESNTESKLNGVIKIVNRSDNSGMLNLGISENGTLFFKNCSRESSTVIDDLLNSINTEFDNKRFKREDNYTLSHVVTSFCSQLLKPPESKPSITSIRAKELSEKKEKKSGFTIKVLDRSQQARLDDEAAGQAFDYKTRLDEWERDKKAREEQIKVLVDLKNHLNRTIERDKERKAAAAAEAVAAGGGIALPIYRYGECKYGSECHHPPGYRDSNHILHTINYSHPPPPCRYGSECRYPPGYSDSNGRLHTDNYSHPLPKGGGSRPKSNKRTTRTYRTTRRSRRRSSKRSTRYRTRRHR